MQYCQVEAFLSVPQMTNTLQINKILQFSLYHRRGTNLPNLDQLSPHICGPDLPPMSGSGPSLHVEDPLEATALANPKLNMGTNKSNLLSHCQSIVHDNTPAHPSYL